MEEPDRTSPLAAFIADPIFDTWQRLLLAVRYCYDGGRSCSHECSPAGKVTAVVCVIVANTAYTTYSAESPAFFQDLLEKLQLLLTCFKILLRCSPLTD